jgi:hypothetical protein
MTYSNVVGDGQIIASGQMAPPTPPAGNDAPGGGGGGGTIVVNANGTISSAISLIANGGDGGDQVIAPMRLKDQEAVVVVDTSHILLDHLLQM